MEERCSRRLSRMLKRNRKEVDGSKFIDGGPMILRDVGNHSPCHKEGSSESRSARSITPPDVIQRREEEWRARQRKRREKYKTLDNDIGGRFWNTDERAQESSCNMFTSIIDTILSSAEAANLVEALLDDNQFSPDLLIEKSHLLTVHCEAQKLKSWKIMNKVDTKRIIMLMIILEKIIRGVIKIGYGPPLLTLIFNQVDGAELDSASRKLITDRVLKAVDASCTVMLIMTSGDMPKQIFIEDAIESSLQFCRWCLDNIVFPACSVICSNNCIKTKQSSRRNRSIVNQKESIILRTIYRRMIELVMCLSELVHAQSLTDSIIAELCTLAISPFFVDNMFELQIKSMTLLTAVFSQYTKFREIVLHDLHISLNRIRHTRSTRLVKSETGEYFIDNFSLLIVQLVQCITEIPSRCKSNENDFPGTKIDLNACDVFIKESYIQMKNVAITFLQGFLKKCSPKSEEGYQRLFDQFLHNLLTVLYKPEWPAAEMLLHTLANMLITFFRSKNVDMSMRMSSLDYLSTIAVRLRQCKMQVSSTSTRLNQIVRYAIYEEMDEIEKPSCLSGVNISHLNQAEKIRIVQQAFIDYLIGKKAESDTSVEYAVKFYIGEWYKSINDDSEAIKFDLKHLESDSSLSARENKCMRRKLQKGFYQSQSMKIYYITLGAKAHLKERARKILRAGCVLNDEDAMWIIHYFASMRDFSRSFVIYLKHILYGIHAEHSVGLRTKAMRCLSLIIESDSELLTIPDVYKAVHARLVDSNVAVREATLKLIGKYVITNEECVQKYYPILIERIKDSGVAVRKRVIHIMRQICDKYEDFHGIPEMLSKIIRRMNDSEEIQKLASETFRALFFQPIVEWNNLILTKKVMTMINVALICIRENIMDLFEQLLISLLKNGEQEVLLAARRIVDLLVDNLLSLNLAIAKSGSVNLGKRKKHKSLCSSVQCDEHQEKLLVCLAMLSSFSKVHPNLLIKHVDTLQPYLSTNLNSQTEQRVLNQIINMLERIIRYMEHPSENFLKSLDQCLCVLVADGNMRIIDSALACISAVCSTSKKLRSSIIPRFLSYLRLLNRLRLEMEKRPIYVLPSGKSPIIQRALYSVGVMMRYFDMDNILKNDSIAKSVLNSCCIPEKDENSPLVDFDLDIHHKIVIKPFAENVFHIFAYFCQNCGCEIRMKALIAIGNFTAFHVEYLCRKKIEIIYQTLLGLDNNEYNIFKIQTLKNIDLFLISEESRSVRSDGDWNYVKAAQDLKEMELTKSGMASTIIQIYWNAILNSYFNSHGDVRLAAVQVVASTLHQGLVTPGSSIPTLIAMSTDPLSYVRKKANYILSDINTKYAGMVSSMAIPGFRCTFLLQQLIRKDDTQIVRGIRHYEQSFTAVGKASMEMNFGAPKHTNIAQASLSSLYQIFRKNRSVRRRFLSSILKQFSEDCIEKLTLRELLFVADNLALFPYEVQDEPLFVIRQIEWIVSISGQCIIDNFMAQLLPQDSDQNSDDGELDSEVIYKRLPEDKSALHECLKNSQPFFLLLYLKTFLMKLYGFSETQVEEYSPSEASKVYEKSLIRKKNMAMFFPMTALRELQPEITSQRDAASGDENIVNQIVFFHNMLLALNQNEQEEGCNEADAGEKRVIKISKPTTENVNPT